MIRVFPTVVRITDPNRQEQKMCECFTTLLIVPADREFYLVLLIVLQKLDGTLLPIPVIMATMRKGRILQQAPLPTHGYTIMFVIMLSPITLWFLVQQ